MKRKMRKDANAKYKEVLPSFLFSVSLFPIQLKNKMTPMIGMMNEITQHTILSCFVTVTFPPY